MFRLYCLNLSRSSANNHFHSMGSSDSKMDQKASDEDDQKRATNDHSNSECCDCNDIECQQCIECGCCSFMLIFEICDSCCK